MNHIPHDDLGSRDNTIAYLRALGQYDGTGTLTPLPDSLVAVHMELVPAHARAGQRRMDRDAIVNNFIWWRFLEGKLVAQQRAAERTKEEKAA